MPLTIVTFDGRPRINPAGAAALFAGCLASCVMIPSTIFWLAFGDRQLVSTTLGVGIGMAFSFTGMILGLGLRQVSRSKPRLADDLAG